MREIADAMIASYVIMLRWNNTWGLATLASSAKTIVAI